MILPDFVRADLNKSRDDHRLGWEWGHTEVFTLRRSEAKPYGLSAGWNRKYKLAILHKDIQAILEKFDVHELAKRFIEPTPKEIRSRSM